MDIYRFFWQRRFLYLGVFFACALFYQHFMDASQLTAAEQWGGVGDIIQELSWKGWFTIGVLMVTLYALVTEVRSPDIVMLVSAAVLGVFGTLTPKQLLQGFSNEIVVTIAMLFIIVRALEVNGILDRITKKALPKAESPRRSLFSLLVPVSVLSAFLNNTIIVLMMTPIVRKWTLDHRISPSKFLIPLSYASIVGGMCTLIGTSTNIIVNSLLHKHHPGLGLSFFELSYVGIPCVIVAIIYIVYVGYYLLPVRQDITSAVAEHTKEFTGEFIVTEECPLVDMTIKDASEKYFEGKHLAEIERANRTMMAPGPYDVIMQGDRLIFVGDINKIAELHTIKGLLSTADPHFQLKETSSHFSEVVVSLTSSLISKTIRQVNFRKRFGASVFAVYRGGERIPGNVADVVLDPGDTLVLLSSEPWEGDRFLRDFYVIRLSEKLTIFNPLRAAFIFAVLIGMVCMVMMGTPIMMAVMVTALVFLFTRSITVREAQKSILWNVLLLIASSFAVATAVEATGVATFFAKVLLTIVGTNPYWLIGGILLITCIFTEMLSNNAAALLLFPVAWQAALLAGYSSPEALKSVGVAIAVGASCGFALPTGYQTHLIVYGPGGYHFRDFFRIGVLLDLLVLSVATALIPYFWPLVAG